MLHAEIKKKKKNPKQEEEKKGKEIKARQKKEKMTF